MSGTSAITFVMPAYNAAATLAIAVESLQAQTSDRWRMIVVDDGSSDATVAVGQRLAAADERIRFVALDANGGAGAARNRALGEVETEYLAFFDADDTLDPDLVERVLRELDERPADIVVFGLVEEFSGAAGAVAGGQTLTPSPGFYATPAQVRGAVLALEESTLFGYQCNRVYATRLIRDHGLEISRSRLYEDYFFNLEATQAATSMLCLDFAPYHYIKGQATSITGTAHIPEYWELSERRVATMLEAQQTWGLADDDVRDRLGVMYLRYLLSAVSRNADERAGMSAEQQEQWLRDVVATPLFGELGHPKHNPSRVLRAFAAFLGRKQWGAAIAMGRGVHVVKNTARPVYERLTRKARPAKPSAGGTRTAAADGAGPTRVLVYGMTDNPGGIESYLLNRYDALDHDQIIFDFVCDFPAMVASDRLQQQGSRVFHIPAKGKDPVGHIRTFRALLAEHPEYRTVYFNLVDAGQAVTVAVAKAMGRRTVVHSHNSQAPRARLHQAFVGLMNRVSDDTFACATGASDFMFGSGVDAPVIPNAIDLTRFGFTAQRREAARAELGLDGLVLLTVGRMQRQKNPVRIVEIMAAVVAQNPTATLLWAGDGELRPEVEARIAELGLGEQIRLLGRRDDVPELMCAADVFVLPSLYEGLAFVLVEAQSAGLPCVVSTTVAPESDAGGISFVALESGDDIWATAILDVAARGRVDTAQSLAIKGYDVHRPNAEITQLLQSLTRGGTR